MCHTGAVSIGVDVTRPSLPVCPLVATILMLSKSSFTSHIQATISTAKVGLQGNTGCAGILSDHLSPLLSHITQHSTRCATGLTQVVLPPLLFTTSATHCLWNVLVPRYHFKQLILLVLHHKSRRSPQKRCFLCGFCVNVRVCCHCAGMRCCLWGLVLARCLPCAVVLSSRTSVRVVSSDTSARTMAAIHTPQGSLLQELFMAAVLSPWESVARSVVFSSPPSFLVSPSFLSLASLG